MNLKLITAALAVILVLLGGVYLYKNNDKDEAKTVQVETHSEHTATTSTAKATLTEQKFLEGMIPHHEEAIASARAVLERGGTRKEVRELAQAIILAQDEEVNAMKKWYESWYQTPYSDTGSYVPMMRDLSSLRGKALDEAFLTDMVDHHMHAINMAHEVVPGATHAEIITLARRIADTQSNEIVSMKIILRQMAATSTEATQ